jgi:Putative  PD-(D/E)XK family member, (DUF4420)
MTDVLTELRSKWKEALASGAAGHQWRAVALSVACSVKLLAGVRDRDGRLSLLLETPVGNAPKHRVRFQAEGISLIDERWADERLLRLAITLERADLLDIFEILAVDLVSVAQGAAAPEAAVREVIRRLEAWQACLRARQRGLTKEEQAGLLGELAVIELAATQVGWPRAVSCWRGPLDGIHDFEGSGVAVEVKASIGVSHLLRISRLDQLDDQGLTRLIVARAKFQETPDGATLPEVVGRVRAALAAGAPSSVPDFEEKLMRAGYLNTDQELYGFTRTTLGDLHAFAVREGFPRLTGASVPTAIVDAAYAIDERQLASFRLRQDEFLAALRQMGGAHD